MPASLNAAYHNAEQAFGVVSSMDWAAGTTMVTALKKSLEQVRADLKAVTSANDVRAGIVTGKEDLIDSDVSSLEDAIRAHDRDSAKRLANRLTMPIAELANMYGSSIQGELMMLRYYSRQFDIAAATDDKPLLQQTADNVRQTWSGLRPAVAAKGGITEAQHFSDLVSALEKSGPPGELGAALRDRIDEIQEVLNR